MGLGSFPGPTSPGYREFFHAKHKFAPLPEDYLEITPSSMSSSPSLTKSIKTRQYVKTSPLGNQNVKRLMRPQNACFVSQFASSDAVITDIEYCGNLLKFDRRTTGDSEADPYHNGTSAIHFAVLPQTPAVFSQLIPAVPEFCSTCGDGASRQFAQHLRGLQTDNREVAQLDGSYGSDDTPHFHSSMISLAVLISLISPPHITSVQFDLTPCGTTADLLCWLQRSLIPLASGRQATTSTPEP
ncbi:hypothetical protein B0H13DRAFT_1877340 [Mycena leptocephala]|nr:hypothetical protein B0H13DRAFT_1877340 [Mycena leptocephala]